MLADLDLLLLVVYCIADDFLPKRPGNARRAVSDAEIVTLCVAQAIMGIPSDYRFIATAGKRLRHLFPTIPTRDAFHKRRARCERQPGQVLFLIGDKNFRGQDFETELAKLEASIQRPRRKDEPGRGPHLAPIRQRIESIFWTFKDILTLERHGARTLRNLRVRLCARFAALAAAVALNHELGRPTRSLVCYTA